MKSMLRTLLVAAVATVMVSGAFAQTKTAPPTAPKGTKPTSPKVLPAPPKAPMGDKFWGGVTKDPIKDGVFKFGSADKNRKGTFSVETKGARVVDKAGKFVSVKDLKPGANVTVMGKLTGTTIKATVVTVNYVPGKTGGPSTVSKPAAGVKPAGTKPPTKPPVTSTKPKTGGR